MIRARRMPHRRPVANAQTRRLLVDVSMIARDDARTGIQRVVRSIAVHMQRHPQGVDIQPVRSVQRSYRYSSWPAGDEIDMQVIRPLAGDVFLGLDLSFDAIRRNARQLRSWRRAGMRFWFVVYDLLPLQSPQYFSPKVVVRFSWWLLATAKLADGYLCISPHVADDLKTLLAQRFSAVEIEVDVFPMGFDIPVEPSVTAAPPSLPSPLSIESDGFILAVGTVEPRKGYELLLDAFDHLWEQGSKTTLIIVGKGGWETEALQSRLRDHREMGRHLRWLQDLADDALLDLYDTARALVVPSHGEGFGLPILEARARSCPVLARDIPAFRTHAAQPLRFFPANASAIELACAISETLRDSTRLRTETAAIKLSSWRAAADAILRRLLES